MSNHLKFSLIFLLLRTFLLQGLTSCGPKDPLSNHPSEISSAQEPHHPRKGPWFEGWYARATNLKDGGSLAVIVGSHVAPNKKPVPGESLPGYIGILQSDGHGNPTKSWTYFPKSSTITLNDHPVTRDPNLFNKKDAAFRWEAKDSGLIARFENNSVSIVIAGEIEVMMEFSEAKGWDKSKRPHFPRFPLGPEGYLAGLPVPLHWYVKSLNAPGRYTFKAWSPDGSKTEIAADGSFHLEKNWGQVFPKAWNWLQAHAPEADAQIVLGGGIVNLSGFDLSAWLGGYRSPIDSWDIKFSDPGTVISVKDDSCSGFFQFIAKRLDLEVQVTAQAPLGSFGSVAVPTAEGFVADLGVESFSGQIEVKTYRKGLFGKRLTDTRVFTNGAVEFGAGSYRKDCP